ncbi:hypothetical protein SAMN02800694_3222 [Luteibacter sp. UNCMF331Sha3.1]|uniref:hypothetical protein n=1 Tax=Luteibacter sp. UNCMF331Sha3.1 TaxID=1502760 RepID=UPI0008BCB9C6|nr:hypothetical protein [Luteibacter sp. UNCMF331Sha3.1]SEN33560.1 hypothetical protein SAMN02800694_3222 [Luteibacter sp. UNCMF331Sha3.1]
MRNTKLIVAMLAGCMAVSGAALAQQKTEPMSSSTAATPTHSTSDSMKGADSMKQTGADGASQDKAHSGMNSSDSMKSGDGSMKSTHKKHMKKGDSMSEPAKSSTSGM